MGPVIQTLLKPLKYSVLLCVLLSLFLRLLNIEMFHNKMSRFKKCIIKCGLKLDKTYICDIF